MGIFDELSFEEFSLDKIKELEENKDVKSLSNQLNLYYESNRMQIAEALGNIGNPKAVESLVLALGQAHEDNDLPLEKAVFEALKKIGDAAIEPIIKVLGNESDRSIPLAAGYALVKIGEPAVESLLRAMKDKNWRIRGVAMGALAEIGSPGAVDPIIEALNDSDWRVQKIACDCLGEMKNEKVVEPLIQAMDNPHPDVNATASEAIVKIGEPAVEPLIKALKDEKRRFRRNFARALGEIGDARAFEPMIELLKGKDKGMRCEAAEALGKMGDARAVNPLIHTLKDKKGSVRYSASTALANIGKPSVEPLKQALNDEDKHVRRKAQQILIRIEFTQADKLVAQKHGANRPQNFGGAYILYFILSFIGGSIFSLILALIFGPALFGDGSYWSHYGRLVLLCIPFSAVIAVVPAFEFKATTISKSFRDKETFLSLLKTVLDDMGYSLLSQAGNRFIYTSDDKSNPDISVQIEDNTATISGPNLKVKKLKKKLKE